MAFNNHTQYVIIFFFKSLTFEVGEALSPISVIFTLSRSKMSLCRLILNCYTFVDVEWIWTYERCQ